MNSKDSPLIFKCFAKIDDQEIEFDPQNNDVNGLAEKCKLAIAEMVTGQKCYLVGSDS